MIQSTDKAKVRFGAVLVAEVRAVLKVSVLFITFPMFWALYDQQVCNKQGTTEKRFKFRQFEFFPGLPLDLSSHAHERTARQIHALPGPDDVHQRRAHPDLHPRIRQGDLPVGSQVRSSQDSVAEDHYGRCATRRIFRNQGSFLAIGDG